MKKLLLSFSLLIAAMNAKSQIVLFEDDFESYQNFAISNVGSWTLLDIDQGITYGLIVSPGVSAIFPNTGSPLPFIVFNSTLTQPAIIPNNSRNWAARSGQKAMACIASQQGNGVFRNDDWLISPQIALSGSAGNTLSFWAKSCDGVFFNERFTVNVSTIGTSPLNFTKISSGSFDQTSFGPYALFTYNLDAYQGQNVYIGIRCISDDELGFMLDDFKVTAATAPVNINDLRLQRVKVYPNPAKNILNIDTAGVIIDNVSITDLNGRIVKNESTNISKIPISDLSQGMYILTINTAIGKRTEKLIIEY